jgi:hypothetical protein
VRQAVHIIVAEPGWIFVAAINRRYRFRAAARVAPEENPMKKDGDGRVTIGPIPASYIMKGIVCPT